MSKMGRENTFLRFAELPFEVREQIWQCALPDTQNVVIIGGSLGSDSCYPANSSLRPLPPCLPEDLEDPHNGKLVSYGPPALLHTCKQSRAVGLRTYPRCFTKQVGIPVLFNLSKDLLLFPNEHAFNAFLKTTFNTYGTNDFGLPVDLRFLGICGPIRREPADHETTHSRLYLFDRLEELILENQSSLPDDLVDLPFVEDLKEVWSARRTKSAKRLKGYVSEQDLELPKVSFLSLEEIKRRVRTGYQVT
jgi:2EXR family